VAFDGPNSEGGETPMTARRDELPPMWLASACAYIESNAASQLSVADVAAAVKVEPSRLVRDFRDYLGFTPAEFVEDVRQRGRFTY
jgi:transcriptional regulator GlxA family with amidase domain